MNPILQKIQQDISANVTPDNKEAFGKVVEAGKRILFDPSTHQNMELIKNPASRKDPVNTVANGMVGLGFLMYQQSKRTIPPEALLMACVVLICEVLDFSERGLGIKVDNNLVARTVQMFMEKMFIKLGISPGQLQEAILKGKGDIQQHLAGQQGGAGPATTEPPPPPSGGILQQAGGGQ